MKPYIVIRDHMIVSVYWTITDYIRDSASPNINERRRAEITFSDIAQGWVIYSMCLSEDDRLLFQQQYPDVWSFIIEVIKMPPFRMSNAEYQLVMKAREEANKRLTEIQKKIYPPDLLKTISKIVYNLDGQKKELEMNGEVITELKQRAVSMKAEFDIAYVIISQYEDSGATDIKDYMMNYYLNHPHSEYTYFVYDAEIVNLYEPEEWLAVAYIYSITQ